MPDLTGYGCRFMQSVGFKVWVLGFRAWESLNDYECQRLIPYTICWITWGNYTAKALG